MTTAGMIESHVEQASLEWLAELGYATAYGPDVEPEKLGAERDDFSEVVLSRRLRSALERINPQLPGSAIADAMKKVLVADSPSLIENNHRFHRMLVDGVDVEYARPDGSIAGDKAWLVDFDDVERNHWLAVNQFTVVEGKQTKRPDVVVFVNGLPLAEVELKNPADVRHDQEGLAAAPDVQAGDPESVRLQRAAGGERRDGGAPRHADRSLGAVHAVAHRRQRRRL